MSVAEAIQASLRVCVYGEHEVNGVLYGVKPWYLKTLKALPSRIAGWVDDRRVALDEWSWEKALMEGAKK